MVKVTFLAAASALHLCGADDSVMLNADERLTMLQLKDKREVSLNKEQIVAANQESSKRMAKAQATHVKQLAFVENLAKSMVGSNASIDDTAKEALHAIDETLKNSLKILQDSHDTDQALLNTLAGRVTNCHTSFLDAKSENADAKDKVDDQKEAHEKCRTKLGGEIDDRNNKCDELDNFVGGLTPPACSIPDEDLTNYWRNYKNFHDNNYDTWKEKKDLCDAATTLGENTEDTCDGNQEDFESGLCALRLTVVSACETYDSCYSVSRADFDTAFETTQTQESQRKVEWTAVKKIQCYITILLSTEEITMDDIQVCVDMVPGVGNFDLIVPTVPPPQQCNVKDVVNVPCTDGFILGYDGMPGLDNCQACPPLPAHLQAVLDQHAPGMETDDCEGWSIDKKHMIDGTCFMGAYDYTQKTIKKTFKGLGAGCTYKWKAVIDTWASVDNEQMKFSINGHAHNFQSRGCCSCNNGWTEYPHDYGDKVGSHGSHHGGWKDCWKNFEAEFVAPANGEAEVEMFMAIDQHINDEGWGWHDMVFEKVSCPVPEKKFPGQCSCTMTADNDIDEVWVNGIDITATIGNFDNLGNWPHNKVATFSCDEYTTMAVMASDAEAGCVNGGFGMKCKSSNTKSPWHNYEADSTWKAWGTTCTGGRCGHGGAGGDKQSYATAPPDGWFHPSFDDSAWKQAATGNGLAKRTGSSTDICSEDGPAWLFRSPSIAPRFGVPTWQRIYGSGTVTGPTPSAADFNQQIWDAGTGILRRICEGSCRDDYKEMYYVRRTGKTTFNFYERLLVTWDDTGFHTDFDIYSTQEDALTEQNPWTFCNSAVKVGHHGVAFPRDCGVTGFVGGQWNGLTGGQRNYAFELLTTGAAPTASLPDKFPRAGACKDVDEMAQYEMVESFDTPAINGDWDTRANVPFELKKDATNIKRVAYCLKMNDKFAWVSFDWTDANKIGIPVDFHHQGAVAKMNVVSNHPDVQEGTNGAGSIEFWDHCYGTGSTGKYDTSDNFSGDNCYGSMQVHSQDRTVIAFNGWSHGGHCDLQIGDARNGAGHTDGTFSSNCNEYLDGKAHVSTYVMYNN